MAGCEMKKGEELIWSLFEMVRELMPPTAANSERFQRWAEKFHELEHGVAEQQVEQVESSDVAFEVSDDPHEHGSPSRRKRR